MNQTEKIVYGKLLDEGYTEKDIIINTSKRLSPDFIAGTREIEVKKTKGKIIYFTEHQKNLNDNCEIWIFDSKKFYKYTFSDLKNNKTNFRIIFNQEKNFLIDRIHWNILWNIKLLKNMKTLDNALCEALTFYEKHNKKENHKHEKEGTK